MAVEREELWSTLMRFHREVIKPEMEEAITTSTDSVVRLLRNEMNSHFDAIYKRFDRLDSEFVTLHLAVRRLDDPHGCNRGPHGGSRAEAHGSCGKERV